jgi:hypothetical protein
VSLKRVTHIKQRLTNRTTLYDSEMTSTANLTTSYVLMKELDDSNARAPNGGLSHIPVSTITRLSDGSTLHLDEKYRSTHMMRMIDMERRMEYNWTSSKSASLSQNLISKSASSRASSAVDSTRVSRWYRPKDHWLFFGL